MKRIDFMGPPGVGKSTLYRSLTNISQREFFTVEQAKIIAVSNYVKNNHVHALYPLILKSILTPRAFKKELIEKIIRQNSSMSLKKLAEENSSFLEAAISCFYQQNENVLQKINHFHTFIKTLELFSFIHSWCQYDWVLWDESLSHKIFAVLPWDDKHLSLVRKYFEEIPKPEAVIFIDGTTELIIERVKNREKTERRLVLGHQNTSQLFQTVEATRKITQMGVETMSLRKVKILHLSAINTLMDNQAKVLSFIESLTLTEK